MDIDWCLNCSLHLSSTQHHFCTCYVGEGDPDATQSITRWASQVPLHASPLADHAQSIVSVHEQKDPTWVDEDKWTLSSPSLESSSSSVSSSHSFPSSPSHPTAPPHRTSAIAINITQKTPRSGCYSSHFHHNNYYDDLSAQSHTHAEDQRVPQPRCLHFPGSQSQLQSSVKEERKMLVDDFEEELWDLYNADNVDVFRSRLPRALEEGYGRKGHKEKREGRRGGYRIQIDNEPISAPPRNQNQIRV